jgi:hypothetical protein
VTFILMLVKSGSAAAGDGEHVVAGRTEDLPGTGVIDDLDPREQEDRHLSSGPIEVVDERLRILFQPGEAPGVGREVDLSPHHLEQVWIALHLAHVQAHPLALDPVPIGIGEEALPVGAAGECVVELSVSRPEPGETRDLPSFHEVDGIQALQGQRGLGGVRRPRGEHRPDDQRLHPRLLR